MLRDIVMFIEVNSHLGLGGKNKLAKLNKF
jgi:hypothetical protein